MSGLDKLFEHAPQIIAEAAKSRRGMVALVVLALSLIGLLFFQEANVWVRVAVFVMMFGGFIAFVLVVFSRYPDPEPSQPQSERLDERAANLLAEGMRLWQSGHHEEARLAYEEARTLYYQIRDHEGEANALWGLGEMELTLGHKEQARTAFEQARKLFQLGDKPGSRIREVNALMHLGEKALYLGHSDQAWVAFKEARKTSEQIKRPDGEASALIGLGHVEQKLGHIDEARSAYEEAYNLSKVTSLPPMSILAANALMGLGRLEADHNAERAKDYYLEAARLYEAIGEFEQEREALNEAEKLAL